MSGITSFPASALINSEEDPVYTHDHEVSQLLGRLERLLGMPIGFDPALNRLRVEASIAAAQVLTQVNAVTTVSTVTTVTGLTNIDSQQGRLLPIAADISAWSDCVRSRIT